MTSFDRRILKFVPVLIFILNFACGKGDLAFKSDLNNSGENGLSSSGTPFVCQNPSDTGISQISRLSKNQYINALTDIFGASVVAQAKSVLDVFPDDFDSEGHLDVTSFTASKAELYMEVAYAIAAAVTASDSLIASHFGACALASTPLGTCIDTYLNSTALRIYRRPLTAAEVAEAKNLMMASGAYRTKLKNLLARHLQEPAFLFRLDIGSENVNAELFRLTPYEIATKIALAATDSIPDWTLLNAAKNGQLQTVEQITAQVRRLLATTLGKSKIISMFRYWLLLHGGNIDFSTLPPAFVGSTMAAGLSEAADAEMDRFLDYVIFEKKMGYRELLTSRVSFASHPDLANIYGHAPVAVGQSASFSGRRQGLLMRVPFLSGGKTRSGLVHRGVTFRRRVLCEDMPGPSPEVLKQRSILEPGQEQIYTMTTRTYVQTITNMPVCLSCHSKINPTGAAFEHLDSMGRLRSQENIFDSNGTLLRTLPVDTTGEVPMSRDQSVLVNDAYDLVDDVAKSVEGPACFARQAYRFFNQRNESIQDSCAMASVYSQLTKSGASVLDAFSASIANAATGLKRRGTP